jgi:hypothetical protein
LKEKIIKKIIRLGEKSILALDFFIPVSPSAPFRIYMWRELIEGLKNFKARKKCIFPQL